MPGARVVAWLDVTAGVAGDMLLGALVDAGADLEDIRRLVDLVLPDAVRLTARPVQRAGLRALKVDVASAEEEHPHRLWREIRGRIASAGLPEPVAEHAAAVFERLATVEGSVHGVPVDEVEFHEVGAWDSVADVVGTCAALHLLGVQEVVASSIALGSGSVRTAHGVLPVPVPAVVGLIEGWSVTSGPPDGGELATPTGVALVTTLAAQGPLPAMEVAGSGVGAGTRDNPDRPNVVRVLLGARTGSVSVGRPMRLLEANVDDLDPRFWPTVLAALLDAGAADAWLTPILMKKGRPAHTLSVLATPESAPALRDTVVALTTTFGVRETHVDRWALDRGWVDVVVDGRGVAVKVAHQEGVVVHATPEFEDAARVAAEIGRPVRDVVEAVTSTAYAQGLTRGATVPSDLRGSVARDSRSR